MELIDLKARIAAQPPSRYPEFETEWLQAVVAAGISPKHLPAVMRAFHPSARCGHRALDGIHSEAGMFHEGWEELSAISGVKLNTARRLVDALKASGLAVSERRGRGAGRNQGNIIRWNIPGVGTFDDWKECSLCVAA